MPRITFVNEHRHVDVAEGASVYDASRANGIALEVARFRGTFHCGGRGVCRACLCWVEEGAPGAAGPRSFLEKLRGLSGWRRLACRTRVTADVRVFTLPAAGNRVGVARPIAPAPTPTTDDTAPRKAIDAASTAEHVHGHPSMIGRGGGAGDGRAGAEKAEGAKDAGGAPSPPGAPSSSASSSSGESPKGAP